MGASAYVGRVGGLAIALGVGAAVATGHGVAWATESEPGQGPSTSEPSASAGVDSGSQTGTTSSQADEADTDDTEVTDDAADEDDEPDQTAEEEDAADESEDVTSEEPEPAASAEESTQKDDTDEVSAHDESSDGDTVQSEQTSVSRMSTTTSNVEARTEDIVADAAVTPDDAETSLQPVTFATEATAYQAQSFMTTMQTAAPVIAAAPQTPRPLLSRVVVNLLSSLGIGALAAKLPGAPIWSPFAMALLALGTRREIGQLASPFARTIGTTPVAALALTDVSTAAVTTYPGTTKAPKSISANTHFIEFVTGKGNLNNTTTRFGIGGTDLGIMWDNGIPDNPATPGVDEHQVLIAFGDTFSNSTPVRTGVWRFNTLFRSADGTLTNGLYVPNGVPFDDFSGSPMERPNWSDPILPSPGQPVHPPYAVGPEVTIIPTAGISAPYNNPYGARQYMNFMSIRSWDTPGRWTTNYSGMAYSDDNGQTWNIAPTSIRTAAAGRATVPFVSGNQNFQQGAFVEPPTGSPQAAQGWVYSYGTPSGRAGTVYLSRVQQDQILDVTKYQYWNGTSWVANTPSAATPILPGKTSSFFGFFKSTKYPSVSEMSVQYNPYLDKYVMLYGDSSNNVVMRTASSPEGTWSAPTKLVSSWKMPGLYAPFIHPWSGTDNLSAAEQQYLYWNLSTWNDYQVRLMRTDLTKL